MNHWENFNKPISSRLGKLLNHGGSSIVYDIGQNQVAKEKLSKYAKDIIPNNIPVTQSLIDRVRETETRIQNNDKELLLTELKENQIRLLNNLKICEQYLGNFILKTKILLEENKNNIPTIYIVQDKIPEKSKFLGSIKGLKMDNERRTNLSQMIDSIKKMYQETGLMIDLLSLNNVAFSDTNNSFYLYDIDPLICNEKNYISLKDKYEVDFKIDDFFETISNQKTTNALEACLDHLEHVRGFLEIN